MRWVAAPSGPSPGVTVDPPRASRTPPQGGRLTRGARQGRVRCVSAPNVARARPAAIGGSTSSSNALAGALTRVARRSHRGWIMQGGLRTIAAAVPDGRRRRRTPQLDVRHYLALYRHQGSVLRRGLSGRLHPVRRRCRPHALHRPDRLHRLRRVRAGLPGGRDLHRRHRPGRGAALHPDQRTLVPGPGRRACHGRRRCRSGRAGSRARGASARRGNAGRRGRARRRDARGPG